LWLRGMERKEIMTRDQIWITVLWFLIMGIAMLVDVSGRK